MKNTRQKAASIDSSSDSLAHSGVCNKSPVSSLIHEKATSFDHFSFCDIFFCLLKSNIIPGCPIKMYLTFTLNFGALSILMSGNLTFPVSPDLYNSLDTLHICFHGLLNKWRKLFSKLDFSQHWNCKEFRL